jgi:undecaprenyl-diphosphatase
MPLLHILILAIVQGLTEFLPISSSGHLVFTHHLLGHEDGAKNLILDIAVHTGTLAAVILYFQKDLRSLACLIFSKKKTSGGEGEDVNRDLFFHIIVSSLPVIIFGFLFHIYEPDFLRTTEVMAWMTLIFGVVLWYSDRNPRADRTLVQMGLKDALIIGFSQILALIPGTSRSGITMTAARFYGFSRIEAARYSMLLGVIAISGAGFIGCLQLMHQGSIIFGWDIIVAVALSFVTAYISIVFMMRWLAKASFKIFAGYRILLALALFIYIYSPLFS